MRRRRLRIVVHALDRTGPPVLVRTFVRWLAQQPIDIDVDVVALRGGPVLDDLVRLAPVHVLLDPHEPWHPDPVPHGRVEQLRARARRLQPADATLAVSTSATTALPLLDGAGGSVLTWVVEAEEAYPPEALSLTDRWIAGSEPSRDELRAVVGVDAPLVVEFVESPEVQDADLVGRCRTALGADPDELLVLGAGIATARKGADLFLELALAVQRLVPTSRFAWIGGETDPLIQHLRTESARLGLGQLRFLPGVADVSPWFAAADVFAHPARYDSLPNVCLSAAAAGTPVAAFRGAGGWESLVGTAFVGADYPDVGGLAREVACLRDPRRRADVATEQRRQVGGHTAAVAAPNLWRQIELAMSTS